MTISHISGYILGNLAIMQHIKKNIRYFRENYKKLGEKNI